MDNQKINDAGTSPIGEEETERIDALYFTPQERAEQVWAGVGTLSFDRFDLLCFAVSYCAQMAIAIEDEIFTEMVRLVGRRYYDFHYNEPQILYGPPDKVKDSDALQQIETDSIEGITILGGDEVGEEDDKVVDDRPSHRQDSPNSEETGLHDSGSSSCV